MVPGLLTVSKTEAITAWRAICSSNLATPYDTAPPQYEARVKHHEEGVAKAEGESSEETDDTAEPAPVFPARNPLKDGRDVYLLRFETDRMLKTGRLVVMFHLGCKIMLTSR